MYQQDARERSGLRVPNVLSSVLLTGFLLAPAITHAQQKRTAPPEERRQEPQRGGQRATRERNQKLLQMHSNDMIADLVVMELAERSSFYPHMKVSVDQGVVTLSGKVRSETAEHRALRIARRTPAVISVRDQLEVDPALKKTDKPVGNEAELAKAVAQEIAASMEGAKAGKDWWYNGWRVEGRDNTWSLVVEVTEPGRVVLEGELPGLDLAAQAIVTAVEVGGVQNLQSELELDDAFYRYHPFPYYGSPFAYPFAYYPFHPYALGHPYAPTAATPEQS
jgi:osmotically-inducible protein OsmY